MVLLRFFARVLTGVLLVAFAAAHADTATRVERSGDAILFEGRIDARSVARFRELLRDGPDVRRLVITSGGGLVRPAIEMAWAIHDRQLDVEVPSTCLSSCANYVFPAGHRKLLGRPGAVAWHGNMAHVLHLDQTGQGRWNQEELASARELAEKEAQLFAGLGVDGFVCWFAKLAPYDVEDFYYLSAQDMAGFGIRGVEEQPGTPPAEPEFRHVRVDWAAVPALRPAGLTAPPPPSPDPKSPAARPPA